MQSLRQFRQLGAHAQDLTDTDSLASTISGEGSSTMPEKSGDEESSDDAKSPSHKDAIVIGWTGPRDPLNPRNWSLAYRSAVFALLWINVFAVDWASSADSQAGKKIAKQFHVSEEAEALSPALYTFGLAAGSLIAGPLSETFGRNAVYIGSRCFHVVWLLGAALAPNFGAQIVFRLFAGLSGSVLLAIHAASTADLFGPLERTIAWPTIALASFWGTAASPIVGAWIAQSSTISWRWTDWIALILSGATLILTLLFLPETFTPILLSWKAKELRRTTGDVRYLAEIDFQDTLWKRFRTSVLRALHMVTREPIVPLLGAWIVIEYLVVFGFLQGFTYIFGDDSVYDFSKGLTGTCFAALALGVSLWTATVPVYYVYYRRKVASINATHPQNDDLKKAAKPGEDLPEPEYRLWSAFPVAIVFPISLFWLGWTNYASISPFSGLGAVTLLGISWAGIYVSVYQYILDVYGIYAGSALAMVTCWRYAASGAVNLFSRPMYEGIGVHWSCTLLGILAVLLLPAPFVFMHYGPRIRAKSTFAGRYSRPGNDRRRTGRAMSWT